MRFPPGSAKIDPINPKGEETDKVKRRLELLGEVHEGIEALGV